MHPPARPLALSLFLAGCLVAQNQQVTLTSSKDNTLYFDLNGALSNGAGSRMFCGTTGVVTGGLLRRAVFAFPVAASIPRRSTIVSVTLTLSCAMSPPNSQPVDLHRVLADWGEGTSVAGSGQGGGAPSTTGDATWIHTFFPTSNWQTPGGDFSPTVSGTTPVIGPGPYTWASTAQMVADVQSWLDNPGRNSGWLLRTTETGTNTAKAFETKESTTPANRPQLLIVYTPPPAAVLLTGSGCNGGGPSPLQLAGSGLPRVPNPNFAITLNGGPSGPGAVLFASGLLPAPFPLGGGCFLYIDPTTFLAAFAVTPPTLPLPVPNDQALLGLDLPLQGAGVNLATGALATSNAATLQLGI
jgi:hypothetical protein